MAIEFNTNLSNSTLVRQSQNHSNRFYEETNRKVEAAKLNQDQLAKVPEKISSEPNDSFTLRFQENIPITNTLKTIKIFNETKKPNSVSSNSLEDVKNVSEAEIEEAEENSVESKFETVGKGFYVVSGKVSSSKGKLLQPANADIVREKLKEFYNSSSKKENGSLVNLTF